jgi:y4mF family transcriptional regulator
LGTICTKCDGQQNYYPFGLFCGHPACFKLFIPDRYISLAFQSRTMVRSRSGKKMADRDLTPRDIGAMVRATRKASGLRQDELAGTAGVGLRFIVELEAGKPTAQLGKTLQVLRALGCAMDIIPPAAARTARNTA